MKKLVCHCDQCGNVVKEGSETIIQVSNIDIMYSDLTVFRGRRLDFCGQTCFAKWIWGIDQMPPVEDNVTIREE